MTYRQKQSLRKARRVMRRPRRKRWCRLCSDGMGSCCYQLYNTFALHAFGIRYGKMLSMIEESPGNGTFTHCLHCGNPPRSMR
jgi:hypothetical protein